MDVSYKFSTNVFFSPVQLSASSRKYFKTNTAHLLDRRLRISAFFDRYITVFPQSHSFILFIRRILACDKSACFPSIVIVRKPRDCMLDIRTASVDASICMAINNDDIQETLNTLTAIALVSLKYMLHYLKN